MSRFSIGPSLLTILALAACAIESPEQTATDASISAPYPAASQDSSASPPDAAAPAEPDAAQESDGCRGAADGAYCGASLGLDPASLYMCGNGSVMSSAPCSLGCVTRPPGTSDLCAAADPCAGAAVDGRYCGGPLGGDQAALYTCQDGKTLALDPCINGCALQPAGTNDRCVASDDAGYHLPLACGTSTLVTQGNDSGYSHAGKARYAFDFRLPRGSVLVAMQAGTVRAIRNDFRPGNPCWSGGGQACADQVNRVVLQHDDGTSTLYLHLDSVSVAVGEHVARGEQVGLSGGTGWSTGPHAHVQRQAICASSYWCQSVPLRFAEVSENAGVPATGATVNAAPCP